MLHTGMTIKATEKITLQGFMSKPNSEVYQVVKPTIQMGARKKRITAVVVDELPQAIATEGLTAVKERLMSKRITLADTEVNNDRVGPDDILIGADHYYDFISLNTVEREGVYLLKSPAGYIITGKIQDFYKGVMANNLPPEIPESVIVMRITHR